MRFVRNKINERTSSRSWICLSQRSAYMRLPRDVLCKVVMICILTSLLSQISYSSTAQRACSDTNQMSVTVCKYTIWLLILQQINAIALCHRYAPFYLAYFSTVTLASVLWRCLLGSRKGIRSVKKLSGGMLAWLYVWGEVQICIWPSWCHCHSLSLAPVNPDWYIYLPIFLCMLPVAVAQFSSDGTAIRYVLQLL